jgi:hypothetical protein
MYVNQMNHVICEGVSSDPPTILDSALWDSGDSIVHASKSTNSVGESTKIS